MEKNLFVYVTKGGSFYDRTNGKNVRLFNGKKIQLADGSVEFKKDTEGKLFVSRFAESGREIYTKEISEPGMYLVSGVFTQALVNSPKEVRNLYNRLKATLGKPKFKIESNPRLRKPFVVKMHTWLDKGFNYRFIITTKDSNVPTEMIEEIHELVTKASKLDLRRLLEYYGAFNNNGVVATIDESFFETVGVIAQSFRETAPAI